MKYSVDIQGVIAVLKLLGYSQDDNNEQTALSSMDFKGGLRQSCTIDIQCRLTNKG